MTKKEERNQIMADLFVSLYSEGYRSSVCRSVIADHFKIHPQTVYRNLDIAALKEKALTRKNEPASLFRMNKNSQNYC